MASMSYEEVFSRFLGGVTDPELLAMNQTDAYSLMTELLHKSVSDYYVRHLFSSITLDDEILAIEFEMAYSVDDGADAEFVATALSKWMVYEWLQKQMNSKLLTQQMFAGREQKFYAQSAHLAEVKSLRDMAYKEAYDFVGKRGIIFNEYLGNGG